MPRRPDLSIIGQTYNHLEVLEITDQRNGYGGQLYRCRCLLCGGERYATRANLLYGEIKDCGCSRHKPRREATDLRGKRFGRLLVTDITVVDGKMRYVCLCDCGNYTTVRPQSLSRGTTQSCGCLHKGDDASIKQLYISGTAPCKLDSSKLRNTNTSGKTGVWYDTSRDLWCAEITFRRKKYFLGRFSRLEDAIKVRQEAEEQIFGSFLEWYKQIKGE